MVDQPSNNNKSPPRRRHFSGGNNSTNTVDITVLPSITGQPSQQPENHSPTSLNNSSLSRPDAEIGIPIRYRTLSIHLDDHNRQTNHKTKEASVTGDTLRIADIKHHLNRIEDVCTRFSTHPTRGLDAAIVARKAAEGRRNKISPPKSRYFVKAMTYVFGGFNFLMWVAFILTVLSYEPLGGSNPQPFSLGLSVLLIFVIALSTAFYAFVDWNASRIMKSITTFSTTYTTVIRDGERKEIPSVDVVVGDLVELTLGQRVSADLRIVSCSSDAMFDRAILTGESKPVKAAVDPTDENPLETLNLAFSSTFLVQGTLVGVVFAIGDDTVMGQLVASSGRQKTEMTTIQREINLFTLIISVFASSMFVISMLFYQFYVRTTYPGYEDISVAIVNAIGCLTSFVPVGLPIAVALSLTIVARRMARQNVLVKNLAIVETLGCMSVLCSDKTGTLTVGKMFVQTAVFVDKEYSLTAPTAVGKMISESPQVTDKLAMVGHLCNSARFVPATASYPVHERKVKGDPTDTAILRFVEEITPHDQFSSGFDRLFEIPFNSKNKWMATIVRNKQVGSKPVLMLKGAPDILLASCSTVLKSDGSTVELDATQRSRVAEIQERLSSSGQRVLALCYRPITNAQINWFGDIGLTEKHILNEISGMVLVGLVGIRDPPRDEVPFAIDVIRKAGVRVFMVTGDFIATATAIASQIGLITNTHVDSISDVKEIAKRIQAGDSPDLKTRFAKACNIKPEATVIKSLALSGADLMDLESLEWDIICGLYTEIVFARTSPDQKLRIVNEFKKRGDNTVAVTGDGVNDAPALKAADIGVAMGSGVDVAKEAAAMVLMTNNFTSILAAIENGRLVFDNLKKVLLYLSPAGSYTEFLAVVSSVFFGMPIPLNTYLQVFFCVFNDVSVSISLMFETPEADLMTRKPRNARLDRLTDFRFFLHVYFFIGLMMWIGAMSCWFLFFAMQGIHFYDLVGAWNMFGYYGGAYNYVISNSAGTPLSYLNTTAGIDVTSYGLNGSYVIPEDISKIPPAYTAVLQNLTIGATSYLPGFSKLNTLVYSGNSVYYVAMIFMQYGSVLATRNRRVSFFESNPLWGPRRNLLIPVGMVVSFLFGTINVFDPAINSIFLTAPMPVVFWFLPMVFGLVILMMDELRKLIVRTYPHSMIANLAW